MKLEFGKSFTRKLKGRIEQYEFEVGVLDDKPHRDPLEASQYDPQAQLEILGTYAGGPIRKASRKAGEKSTGEILVENMERMNINLLARPFQETNSDIMRFTRAFMQMITTNPGMPKRRLENLLQAIVRNPILRQEYGGNSSATADAKGFDRKLFDTGQMFKAIIARAKRVGK